MPTVSHRPAPDSRPVDFKLHHYLELDYRDGLVDFKYDPKRVNSFVR
jgi:hypothetical protein